jgi:hypothetical protein
MSRHERPPPFVENQHDRKTDRPDRETQGGNGNGRPDPGHRLDYGIAHRQDRETGDCIQKARSRALVHELLAPFQPECAPLEDRASVAKRSDRLRLAKLLKLR